MKNTIFSKWMALGLVGAQLASAGSVFASEVMVADVEGAVQVREMNQIDEQAVAAQLERVQNMSDEELAMELEIQAAQIEAGIKNAEASGIVVAAEDKEALEGLVSGIREEAAQPKLKKRFGQKLMAIPRAIAQGVGYFGAALPRIIFAPIMFTSTFVKGLITGDSDKTAAAVAGYTAMGLTMAGQIAVGGLIAGPVGLAVVVGTTVPVGLTLSFVCKDGKEYKSAYTEKFCANIAKIDGLQQNVWNAGENSGAGVHNFIAKPFIWMAKKMHIGRYRRH